MGLTKKPKEIHEELRKDAMQAIEDLRNDTMEKVTRYLPLKDYIKCGPICSSWSAMARNYCPIPPRFDLPFLVVQNPDKMKTRFCNLSRRVFYQYRFIELLGRYSYCCGSSQGWLVTIDFGLEMCLVDPFSRISEIKLPSLPSPSPFEEEIFITIDVGMHIFDQYQARRNFTVHKVILSADPRTNSDYIVITSFKFSERLAFWKLGASTWTIINSYYGRIIDMLWHKETLYLITDRDFLLTYDMEDQLLIPIHRFPRVENKQKLIRYLVELRGELHIAVRDADYNFVVMKFNLKKKQPSIETLRSIGDNALFLGRNHSMAIPSNEYIRCQSDSIYFTDDDHWFEGGLHNFRIKDGSHAGFVDAVVGNFNIKEGTIRLFPLSDLVVDKQEELPPIWFKAHRSLTGDEWFEDHLW